MSETAQNLEELLKLFKDGLLDVDHKIIQQRKIVDKEGYTITKETIASIDGYPGFYKFTQNFGTPPTHHKLEMVIPQQVTTTEWVIKPGSESIQGTDLSPIEQYYNDRNNGSHAAKAP